LAIAQFLSTKRMLLNLLLYFKSRRLCEIIDINIVIAYNYFAGKTLHRDAVYMKEEYDVVWRRGDGEMEN